MTACSNAGTLLDIPEVKRFQAMVGRSYLEDNISTHRFFIFVLVRCQHAERLLPHNLGQGGRLSKLRRLFESQWKSKIAFRRSTSPRVGQGHLVIHVGYQV